MCGTYSMYKCKTFPPLLYIYIVHVCTYKHSLFANVVCLSAQRFLLSVFVRVCVRELACVRVWYIHYINVKRSHHMYDI